MALTAGTDTAAGPAWKPAGPDAFKPAWHNPPVAQYNTGTCWSFSTTSFYESEVFRLTGEKVKLSEIWTVYWEYVEKVRRFVRERGDSLIAEGSESNAVPRIWKAYGAVPAEAYAGVLSADGRHDHEHLVGQLNELADWVKAHDAWDEERVLALARVVLDRELGAPPTNFTYRGTPYAPKEFLAKVLKLDLDAYVEVMSTLSVPFWTKGSYDVPDNWWKDESYNNVPLDVWYGGLVGAVKAGYTVAIGGDVSEPGINGFEDAAVVPTFDIPQEYIDQDSRELRFNNHTSEDDHGIHLVGMTQRPKFDRGGIDQRVRPGKLQLIEPLAERQHARLLDQRQIGGVIDRELDAVPAGQSNDVDAGGGDGRQQKQGEAEGPNPKSESSPAQRTKGPRGLTGGVQELHSSDIGARTAAAV